MLDNQKMAKRAHSHNHSTVGAYAGHIDHYIDTEKQLVAIIGPFDSA